MDIMPRNNKKKAVYCETIGNISEETIRKYIANQKRNVKGN